MQGNTRLTSLMTFHVKPGQEGTPQDAINDEFIIGKLNPHPLVLVNFRFISAHSCMSMAVNSCEFIREEVTEISTSSVSLGKMPFKKFHPSVQRFSICRNTEKFSEHIHCSLRMQNAKLHLTPVTETTNDSFFK